MRFPLTVRHRKAEAKIYGKSRRYPFYRVAAYVAGKRRMTSFSTYSEAHAAADMLVRDLASGSQSAALTAAQARDALAALERLQAFHQATGRRVSLLAGISEYCEAAGRLNGLTLDEAISRFLATVASVKRQDISQAVEQFVESRKSKTEAKDGKRPQLSEKYAYCVAMWLREFSRTFPNTAVCDLTKAHLNAYMSQHTGVAAKTRNERRNVVRMFLKWCVRQDYLASNHRLLEADGMTRELADPEEIDFYSPGELRDLLVGADTEMRPILALTALAGVRVQEALRLTLEDVFRVPGHVEISTSKSKTRSRRLVPICGALEQWLAPYRNSSGPLWDKLVVTFHDKFLELRASLKIAIRRNGLRHAFCSYHFALHANENLTAAVAGNSPAMIHAHYKGLATRAEAEKWFAVKPAGAAQNVIPLPAVTGRDGQ